MGSREFDSDEEKAAKVQMLEADVARVNARKAARLRMLTQCVSQSMNWPQLSRRAVLLGTSGLVAMR